jgi:hypothetical protein
MLCDGGVFTDAIISSYARAMLDIWEMELSERIIQTNLERIRHCVMVHEENEYDETLWERIDDIRRTLAVTTVERLSLFSEIRKSLAERNLKRVSELQLQMDALMRKMEKLYLEYQMNQV